MKRAKCIADKLLEYSPRRSSPKSGSYRPAKLPKMRITVNDCHASRKATGRTNLKHVESSKRSLRIFLENEILARTDKDFMKNKICDLTSPETPQDLCEIDFSSFQNKLTLLPLKEIEIGNLHNTTNCLFAAKHLELSRNDDNESLVVVNSDNRPGKTAIVIHENHFAADTRSAFIKQEKSSVVSDNLGDRGVDQDILQWHESCILNDETVSIEGSLSGESISKASLCKTEKTTEPKLQRCRRKLGSIFCCLG